MSDMRKNYKNLESRLELIKELRARYMTFNDIKNFLSEMAKQNGKIRSGHNMYEYQVCDRTVRRALDFIKDMYGDQLEQDVITGAYKLELYDFPEDVDAAEIQALDVALQKIGNDKNAKKLLGNLKRKITDRLYRKIENKSPDKGYALRQKNCIEHKIESHHAFVGPRLITNIDENTKSVLDSAILAQHRITFNYHGKEKNVCPLGILHGDNNVYLIACNSEQEQNFRDVRHYILGDIKDLRETQDGFLVNTNFSIEKYANTMFGIYNDGVIYDIKWLIRDPKTIEIARKYNFHPSQEYETQSDGSLIIKMRAGGLTAISAFLAQWGGTIIPIQPKELIDKYRELLKNCLKSIPKK